MSLVRWALHARFAVGTAVSALVATQAANGQIPVRAHYTVSGGLFGGINHSNFRVDAGPEDYQRMWGWAAGAWINLPLGNTVALEFQPHYNVLRYFQSGDAPTSLLSDAKGAYLSVPILFKIYFGDAVALTVGPEVDFLLSVDDFVGVWEKNDVTSTSFALTGGIELMPRGAVSLYARYGYGLTNMDNTGNPATVSKYYNNYFQFGAKVRMAGSFVQADTDGDGIADPQDSCPTQVGSAKYTGCPIPDADSDGVNDDLDRCPTQAGVPRHNGCPPPDTDGDRVNDDDDRCPTQAGVARYSGCPPPDTDGDGVNDDNDRCPTEAGFDRYSGCPPPDTDRDGVDDLADRCPTVAGVREMNGCPRVEAFEAQRVSFASGSARLTATGMSELDKVVGYMNAHSGVSVNLDGHTDSTGPDRVNNPLSQRRAAAAKAYLVSRGIAESRITTAGHGSAQPVAPNDSDEGRARNRRVEMTVR